MERGKIPIDENSIIIRNENSKDISELYHWGIYTRIIKEIAPNEHVQIEEVNFPFEIKKNDVTSKKRKNSFGLKKMAKRIYFKVFRNAPIYFYDFVGASCIIQV